MKELSIEEKAKAYDEVIERAENIKTGKCETTFMFTEGLFDYLFPEIKECNDEEVRKAMIDFFKHEREEGVVVSHYGVNIERMIAWLEKQKTSEEAMQYLKDNHSPSEVSDFQAAMNIAVAKAYDKGVKDGLENRGHTFTKKEVDDAYLAGVRDTKQELEKQGKSLDQIHYWTEEEIEPIISDYLRGAEHYDGMIGRLRCLKPKSLEKQGGQKPVISDDALREGIAHFGITQYQIDNWLKKYVNIEKQGEQNPIMAKSPQLGEQRPAWSKEDEKAINDIMWIIEAYRKDGFNETHIQMADNSEKWLKSLRPQKQWKPSEEQIMCLQDALSDYHRRGYKAETLEALLKQLKQL